MKDTLHIYIRVSTTIQEEEGTSLKTQKEIGVELSKKLGMSYQIHNEGGMSSSKDTLDNRPILLNILTQMDEGIIKNLYVWNTDRLSRNQITWYTIRQKMVKNGVVLYTSNGIHNTTDFMENMILGILSEVSQYDNMVRTERSRLGKIEKVKLNYWRGGDCPFGYKLSSDGKGNKLVENEKESIWVRYIYSEYSKGTPLKEVKSVLEKNGIQTRRRNDLWSMGSLQVILRNEIYQGYDLFVDKKSKMTIRNTIPQLISNKLWSEVQERRKKLLTRKNQINRTTRFYLFRDFLKCECGTPMGGRIKTEKFIRQYYCPLSERKFNNSYKSDIECNMKKCLNIPTTDKILWNKIIDILSDTIELKKTLKEKTIVGISLKSRDLKNEIKSKEDRIVELTKTKNDLEKGIVEIETNKVLNQYPSEEIYSSLKKDLTKRFNIIKSEIEDVRNSLTLVGNQERWFEWIDNFGNHIRSKRDIPEVLKKEVLNSVLDFILVDYDHQEKVHRLNINFKIPVIIRNHQKKRTNSNEFILTPSKTLVKSNDQLSSVENYSTVTDLARFLG
jgi:site-specific DNA recombinase